ncbi:MAG: rRNA maturation RNase YbeY [Thermodesulfovibrionales bacterium]
MRISISNRQRKIRLSPRRLERECRKALRLLGLQRAELSVLLAGPEGIRKLNSRYRGVDRPTDVLSFPLYESPRDFPVEGEFALGDIVLCPSQAARQARLYGVALEDEMRRLLVHGLLHLLGFDHERSGYARRRMERKERELMEALA